ncbi:FtsK/SpoIIIE domain-containing protein [Ruthenibacterium lactatiformans]|uniref:FtsK/SpoIIIE domain-containing protein n=1 Tax=Ruthenibacterium lactatiformans TaxID=1550024 RepID=UPI0026728C88|nr:FtsK/SpoIIIE domain-containing protein [Ruthenibacterium lactatiformans]
MVCWEFTRSPHLLIAGASGSGKSTFLRSALVELLELCPGDLLKLIIIDPKGVEYSGYDSVENMLMPVVKDYTKAIGVLAALAVEIEKRYELFAKIKVRNIESYNEAVNEFSGAESMPHILVIADSFDIVLTAHKDEAEGYIERITQAGRSAGVHLLITTQSVPGKNFLSQFPSKLCFRMPEKSDSKKILGGTASEKLFNEGEAIFYSAGVFPRAQVKTVFKEDSTIDKLLEEIKGESAANYSEGFIQEINRYAAPVQSEEVEYDDSQDPMLKAVVEVVIDAGQASTSLLQRRCKLGYARAARIMDEMEQLHIIGPYEGSKPRQVLITRQQWIEMIMQEAHNEVSPQDEDVPQNQLAVEAGDCDESKNSCCVPQLTLPGEEENSTPPQLSASDAPNPAPIYAVKRPTTEKIKPKERCTWLPTIKSCDGMTGEQFEHFCASLLRANGFRNVKVTQASGDYGIDVLAQKGMDSYAIQCKCYSSPVGNHAVQEAFSGAAYYGHRIPVVMTNQEFTAAAIETAERIGVRLWGRSELARMRSYCAPFPFRIIGSIFRSSLIVLKPVLQFLFGRPAAFIASLLTVPLLFDLLIHGYIGSEPSKEGFWFDFGILVAEWIVVRYGLSWIWKKISGGK